MSAMAPVSGPSHATLPAAKMARHRARKRTNVIALALSMAAMGFGLFWLAWILFETIWLGIGGIRLSLFTEMTPPPQAETGGLANAIFGSAVMVTLATLLGTPKWKVISSVTLKAARAGVLTGILLALARIAGETAPLLFTALSNQFWTSDLTKPMASLPVTIFKFAMSPYENWQKLAWAGVFLITLGVLLLNILARILFKNKH